MIGTVRNAPPSCIATSSPAPTSTVSPSPAPTPPHSGTGTVNVNVSNGVLTLGADVAPVFASMTATQTPTATATPTPTESATPTPTASPTPTLPRFDYHFADVAELDSGDPMGCYFNELADTITKVTLTVHHYQCVSGPTIIVESCTSVTGSPPTTCNGAVTLATDSPTTLGVFNIAIAHAAIGAGDYVCAEPTAGTCAKLDWDYTVHGTVP